MDLLERLSALLLGTEQSRRDLFQGERGARLRYALLGGTLFTLALLLIPVFSQEARRWTALSPEIAVPDALWRVYLSEAPGMCGINAAENDGCPANPTTALLWQSSLTRADADIVSRVAARRNGEYWLGATLPFELVLEARSLDAHQFLLGPLRGDYRVWIDGEYAGEGKAADRDAPLIEIPPGRFELGRAIQIAVRVTNGAAPESDFRAALGSGRSAGGLMTRSKAVAYRRNEAFLQEARPFAVLLLNLFLGALLLSFWNSSRHRAELLFLGLFSASSGLAQGRGIEAVNLFVGHGIDIVLWTLWALYSGPLLFFAGLAFAGARRATLIWGPPLALVTLPALNHLMGGTLPTWIDEWWQASLGTLGALACLLRFASQARQRGPGEPLSPRMIHSLQFALALAALGALGIAIEDKFDAPVWPRLAQAAMITFAAWVARKSLAAERGARLPIPVSRFHRSADLPAEVSGVGLVVHLKIQTDVPGQARSANSCITHVWTAITDKGGIIVEASESHIHAFFEDPGNAAQVVRTVLAATDQISRSFSQLEASMFQGVKLGFHAGLAAGPLRPAWESQGAAAVATWSPSREGLDPLFEAGRMCIACRKLGAPWRAVSIEQALADEITGQVSLSPSLLETKHGETLRFSLYLPGETRAEKQAA